jgi:hypothetical protein
MKPLTWILALVALVVALGVWQLLAEDRPSGDGEAVAIVARNSDAESLLGNGSLLPGDGTSSESVMPLDIASISTEVELPESALPERYLKALGGLTGRVVEEDGTPVTNFPVALAAGGMSTLPITMNASMDELQEFDPILAESLTNSEGRFRLTSLPTRVMGLIILDPGGPRASMHFLEHTPVSGEEFDVGDIVLQGTVTYIGQVLNERQEPLPDVRVRATNIPSINMVSGVADYRLGGGFLVDTGDDTIGMFTYVPPTSLARLEKMLPIPTTHTDADGHFILDGVQQGFITVMLDDNVHMAYVSSPSPSGSPGTTRDMGEMVMSDGVTLEGDVVGEDGKPVPGAEVMAGNTLAIAPVTILRPSVTADEAGHFTYTGFSPRTAHAVARQSDRDSFTPSEAGIPGDAPLRVVLPSKRRLTLTLLNERDAPIPDATFRGRTVPNDNMEDIPDFVFPPRSLDSIVTTDEFDRYLFDDMDPQIWELIVHAPGYGITRETFDLTRGNAEGAVTLQDGLQLRVLVQTEEEEPEPLAHAMVMVYDSGNNDRPLTSQRTDEGGWASFDDIVEGEYRVEAEYPGLAISKATADVPSEEEVVLSLRGGGTIAGSVVDNGEPPLESLMVTLEHESDVATGDKMPRMTITAPDGTFMFSNVPEGDVQVSARERIDLSNLTSWWEPFAMTAMAEDMAYVTAGQQTDMVLVVGSTTEGVPSGSVEGRLIVNGMPAPGWKVRTWGKIRRSVTTGPGGRFNMGKLAAGSVMLMFSPKNHPGMMRGGGAVENYQFELEEGAHEFVDLSISTGSVSGRVVSDRNGSAIEGAAVVLEGVNEKDQASWWGARRVTTSADANGFFEFALVAEGDYTVTAQADELAATKTQPFFVTGMRATDGLLLRLNPGITFGGVVVLEDIEGTPDWMWLQAEAEHGSEATTRPDTKEGNRFYFDDLSPGTWTFRLYSDVGDDLSEVTIRIDHETDDAVLVFRPLEEELKPEAAEPDDGQISEY